MHLRKLTGPATMNHVVETKAGKINGAKIEGTYMFKGVKYAQAKRFHMPTPVEPWEGVKPALSYGHVCPEINTLIPGDEPYTPHFYWPQNEDCLVLNVWTNSLARDAKRPVMVWLHGGGWFSGSSVEIFSYDGENLARDGDVVVVSINHRLNALGYLDLSRYGAAYENSANAGIADMVAALEWVRENIENFGGDPANVTIFGQSGGGAKVLSLLQTPAADGLFHRAIMQSGGAQGKHTLNMQEEKETAQLMAKLTLERLGIPEERAPEIEDVDWYDLAQAAGEAMWLLKNVHGKTNFRWGPVADGTYYYGHPGAYGFRRESAHIPMMVGNVLGEFSNNVNLEVGEGHKNSWDEAYKQKLFRELYGERGKALAEAFSEAYPGRNTADMIYMDKPRRADNIEFCRMRAEMEGAAPIYNWLFTLEAPFMSGTIPWHNADEPYVFRNVEYTESQYEPGVSEYVQDVMSGAWLAFAKSGDPNHDGAPAWPAVTADSCPTMLFDRACEVRTDHDYALVKEFPEADMSKQKPQGAMFPGMAGAIDGFPVKG